MALYRDSICVLETDFLVACWAYDGDGPDDGKAFLHVILEVCGKRTRTGWDYPTPAARDLALQALGALKEATQAVPWEDDPA